MTSRVWFITGASSGFGHLMAEKALENGERVVATLRKPEVICDLAKKYDELEMKTQKKQLLVLKLDVTIKEEISAAFIAAKQTFGRIDVVFNNAGYGIISEVEGVTEANARNLFEVNFWGSFNVAKQALEYFRKNDPVGGLLLNMSSMFGVDAPPGAGFYAATKFAFDAVTDSLAKELDPTWNIKVMIFCPGWFKTNMTMVNAVVEDVHPEYAGKENLGSIQVREVAIGLIRGDSPLLQDARKLIDRFWDLSKLEKPPYRVAFGEDAKAAFKARWTTLKSDLEASEEWSKDLTFGD
ncbi:NAD(P)-binding protein [Mycena sanguinolenta]|uniref:NAD(P)-binding protein n=1 Tax=Mycena sanguinolenta TaxID=230812 RepID=A0A8H6YTE1_9AGAR|nr:NAD(P)-binding protein [Mycena sanguinolenta]